MRRTIFINENPASEKALARIDHVATVTGWTRARATCWLIESAPAVTLYDPFGKPYPEQGINPPSSTAKRERRHSEPEYPDDPVAAPKRSHKAKNQPGTAGVE